MPKKDQGSFKERYKVIPRTLIFITRGKEVLLIKGAPTKKLWANLYNGIGGHIERGEDALTAAKRELREETGLEGIELIFCGNIMINASDDVGISIFVFRGEFQTGNVLESSEGQLEWIQYVNISNYPIVEDLNVLLQKVLSEYINITPFYATYEYDINDKLTINFA